jgi:hypothetical protein
MTSAPSELGPPEGVPRSGDARNGANVTRAEVSAARIRERESARSLETTVEQLEQENEKLEAELALTKLKDAALERQRREYPLGRPHMYPLTRDEELERIQKCEFPTEGPGALPQELVDALEVTEAERTAYAEALRSVRDHQTQVQREVWRQAYGSDIPGRDELMQHGGELSFIERMEALPRSPEDDELHRIIAEEEAGLRPASTALSPFARFKRAQKEVPRRLHTELAERIGPERTHEIRSFYGGWPGGFTVQRGCSSNG